MKRHVALSMAGFMALSTVGFPTNVTATEVESTSVTSSEMEKMGTEVPTLMYSTEDYMYLKWSTEGATSSLVEQYAPYKVHAGDTIYFRSTEPLTAGFSYEDDTYDQIVCTVPNDNGEYIVEFTPERDCYVTIVGGWNTSGSISYPYDDVEVLYLLNGATYEEVDLTGVEPELFYGTIDGSTPKPTEFCQSGSLYETDFNESSEMTLYSDYIFPASSTQTPILEVSSENPFAVNVYDAYDPSISKYLMPTYNNNTGLYELSYTPDYNFYFSIENLGLPYIPYNTNVSVKY